MSTGRWLLRVKHESSARRWALNARAAARVNSRESESPGAGPRLTGAVFVLFFWQIARRAGELMRKPALRQISDSCRAEEHLSCSPGGGGMDTAPVLSGRSEPGKGRYGIMYETAAAVRAPVPEGEDDQGVAPQESSPYPERWVVPRSIVLTVILTGALMMVLFV